jgi:hypothetical protein
MARWHKLALLVLVVGIVVVTLPSSLFAYSTGPRWRGINYYTFYPDPNLDANLRVTGAQTALDASANVWNRASRWALRANRTFYNINYTGTIGTADFTGQNECGPHWPNGYYDVADTTYAIVCTDTDDPQNDIHESTVVEYNRMVFNTSARYVWNTTGGMDLTYGPNNNQRLADVRTVATHEMGHFYFLRHPGHHPEAVMNFDGNTRKWDLAEDDKQGATQMYGPYTGWENGYATGIQNNLDLNRSVTGFYCDQSLIPELGPRPAEFNVSPYLGSRHLMIAGCAQDAYSYAYMRLFTSDCFPINGVGHCFNEPEPNLPQGLNNWLVIEPGMRLRWYQYNVMQSTISLDFLMTDLTTMRDSGLVDQHGVNVHPNSRGGYPTGQWLYFDVDLTPLQGRMIRQWWVAYDNGRTATTGQYRAYIDQISIVYPAR